MKRITHAAYPITILILLLFNNLPVNAQASSVDSLLTKALATDELLPVLIDSAIANSPEVKRSSGNEDYADATLQVTKKSIYNSFSLLSSYNYGTNYSASNNPNGANSGATNFTTAQTGFYNLGIGVQIPLGNLIGRKNVIKAGQSQVTMAAAEKDNAILYTKQEVIRLYQEFKLAHKLLSISLKTEQATRVNNTMAEKNFLNAQLTVDQVSGVQAIYDKAVVDYETNLNRFQTGYLQLEAFTGVNLSKLIMSIK